MGCSGNGPGLVFPAGDSDNANAVLKRPKDRGYNPGDDFMANEGYHEPIAELTAATRDLHRAIQSLMEELEAVDWYNQRVDACQDKELAAILAHNRDEEKEHAAMLLEWIRRRDAKFDGELKDYLFTDKPIAHH
jgi:ferritin-like protein